MTTNDLSPFTAAIEAWTNEVLAIIPVALYEACNTASDRVALIQGFFFAYGAVHVEGGCISGPGNFADHVFYITSRSGNTVRFWVGCGAVLSVTGRDGLDSDF